MILAGSSNAHLLEQRHGVVSQQVRDLVALVHIHSVRRHFNGNTASLPLFLYLHSAKEVDWPRASRLLLLKVKVGAWLKAPPIDLAERVFGECVLGRRVQQEAGAAHSVDRRAEV